MGGGERILYRRKTHINDRDDFLYRHLPQHPPTLPYDTPLEEM